MGSEKALGAQSLSSSFQKTLCTPYVHCVGQWTRALKFVCVRQTFKHSRCTSKLYVRIWANCGYVCIMHVHIYVSPLWLHALAACANICEQTANARKPGWQCFSLKTAEFPAPASGVEAVTLYTFQVQKQYSLILFRCRSSNVGYFPGAETILYDTF